jgi:LL-diaminopimelate aminotransferase
MHPISGRTFSGQRSWDAFEKILNSAHIVTTPGSGFGAAGEGFLRLSAFGHRENIEEACIRLKNLFQN